MYKLVTRNILFMAGLAVFAVLCDSVDVNATSKSAIVDSSQFTRALANNTVLTNILTVSSQKVSPEAEKAIAFISQREGIPIENLLVTNEFHRDAPLLSRSFQAVTVMDQKAGPFFEVLVDRDSNQVEDRVTIEQAEKDAYQVKYGKLQPALYERLQQLQDTDVVTVTIVIAAGPGQSLVERQTSAITALTAKYPEARDAVNRSGKPMDVADPVLAKLINQEYRMLMNSRVSEIVQPLIDALKSQGIAARTNGQWPAVTASLTKRTLLSIVQRDDVGTVYLSEDRQIQQLTFAVPSNRAPAVWARGYDGTGINIAIQDVQNVDFSSPTTSGNCLSGNNCFLHPGAKQNAVNGEGDHPTLTASAAASSNATNRGMASGATIITAGMAGSSTTDAINALDWAISQGADIVNYRTYAPLSTI